MLKSITVKNFRRFSELTLSNLARVNLIAGENNVGKTALLEAIYLHSGPRLPRSRYVFNFLSSLERFKQGEEESWEWLFSNKATEEPIVIAGQWEQFYRTLKVGLEDTRETEFKLQANGPSAERAQRTASVVAARELVLSYKDAEDLVEQVVDIRVTPTGIITVERTKEAFTNNFGGTGVSPVWLAGPARRRSHRPGTYSWTSPYELRYYRLDRLREGVVVKSLDERMLDVIEKTDLEVR